MLTIENTVNGDVNEVKLAGRLDAIAARDTEEAFAQMALEATNVVLDVTDLSYIASAGLRSLKRLRGAVRENGSKLTLHGVQADVMYVLEMTGFAAMLDFE